MKARIFFLALVMILAASTQSCKEMGIDPRDLDKANTDTTLSIEKLVGTKWQLVSIEKNNRSELTTVPPAQLITLVFDSPSQAGGINDCNTYGGSVKIDKAGQIGFENIFSTRAFCGSQSLGDEYLQHLNNAESYTIAKQELRINVGTGTTRPVDVVNTLVFVPYTGETGSGDGGDERLQLLQGGVYTLYSFVNANIEEVLTDSKNCKLAFALNPAPQRKGTVNILAECNAGVAEVSFSADVKEMKLDNISITEMACQNYTTPNRYVDFLQNIGRFELSDNGRTLTIWSSLTTFAESKMILKTDVSTTDTNIIDIQDTPPSGLPASTYFPSEISDVVFDGGSFIRLAYQCAGAVNDFRISAYSLFEWQKGTPPTIYVDLVTEGSSSNVIGTKRGVTFISTQAIYDRAAAEGSSGNTTVLVKVRWNGTELKTLQPIVLVL